MADFDELIVEIGESVFIYYEPHEPEHPWTVGLTHEPMIHEHWESVVDGLNYLVKHKDRFDEWRETIKREEQHREEVWGQIYAGEAPSDLREKADEIEHEMARDREFHKKLLEKKE